MKKTFNLTHLEEIPSVASEFLALCPGKHFAFYGEMGVGKTTFIKALCNVLQVEDVVTSPTFSIVNEYKTLKGEKVYHFDFYRIESVEEAYDMGYEDYFYSDAYCFVEWPEKVLGIIPPDFIKVSVYLKNGKRTLDFELKNK